MEFDFSDNEWDDAFLDLFNQLTDEDMDILTSHKFERSYRKGEEIYSVGETPTFLMCLTKGRVKVCKEGVSGGHPQIIRILKPAQFFGYRAYFAEGRYVTSCVAIDDCDVMFYSMLDVVSIIKSNSAFALFIIRHLSVELGLSDERIISLTQKHVRGRLAEALLTMVDRCGISDDGVIDVKMSRDDIASLANMTTSNAIRTLSAFQNEGIVELSGKRIIILQHEELERISRLG